MTEEAEGPATSVDGFLGNRIQLVQPKRGHRSGLDAVLLQALIPGGAAGHLVDLGTATGAVAMAAAVRASDLTATGVEIDAQIVELAERSLKLPANRSIAERVRFLQADVTSARPAREAAGLADGCADWVTMNPPFDVSGRVQTSPDAARRQAHVGDGDTIARWVRTAAGLLKPRGRLAMVNRADALGPVLDALKGRFGAIVLLPVHPHSGEPATRILISAVRDANAPLTIRPGLVLHRPDGGSTEEAAAILDGVAGFETLQKQSTAAD